MPRAPNPQAAEAHKLYQEGRRLNEIAALLQVPEGTVRRWKSTYHWGSERSDTSSERSDSKSERSERKTSVRNRGGAPLGNQNAKGNPGGGAPKGNTNHLTHGFYWNALSEEEQAMMVERKEPSDEERLLHELELWEIREYRMMQAIERQRAVASGLAVESVMKKGNETITTAINTDEVVRRYEALLNTAQKGRLRCIEALRLLHKQESGEGDGNMSQLLETLETARKQWGDDSD